MKKPGKFRLKDAKMLETYFSSPDRAEKMLTYGEIAGLLFAMACSPELIMPSEWLELIFEGQGEGSSPVEMDEEVVTALFPLYNLILEQVAESRIGFPPGITIAEDFMANF